MSDLDDPCDLPAKKQRALRVNWTVFNLIEKLDSYDRPLRVEDVVDVFGFSKTKVYRMSESKQIPCALLGGTWVYDPSALAMWVANKDPNISKAYRQLLNAKKEGIDEQLRKPKN